MNKKEAQFHVGKRVYVWTALRGEYEGKLVEIKTSCRPWRGVVEITKIVKPAFSEGWRNAGRKTKKIGDIVEAGAISIKPVD